MLFSQGDSFQVDMHFPDLSPIVIKIPEEQITSTEKDEYFVAKVAVDAYGGKCIWKHPTRGTDFFYKNKVSKCKDSSHGVYLREIRIVLHCFFFWSQKPFCNIAILIFRGNFSPKL